MPSFAKYALEPTGAILARLSGRGKEGEARLNGSKSHVGFPGIVEGAARQTKGILIVPTPTCTAIRLYSVNFISANRIIALECGPAGRRRGGGRPRAAWGFASRYYRDYRDAA